jgi:hydrogenase maturation protein HypF
LKGLGGYHLVADARNETAVGELRGRKHRDEKPFAIMNADAHSAGQFCMMNEHERNLLESVQAPIVLLKKRRPLPIADSVAPRNPRLGVMLAHTPLHHLLMKSVGGVPLVMTSGNQSDEPIVYRDDAVKRLSGIADLFLVHDRPIHVRCDDSVIRVVDGKELPIRRSRGYAPKPIQLPFDCPRPILAVGGELKVTFALASGHWAFLSHHLGDLGHYEAFRAFQHDLKLYRELFGIAPEVVAHDLHPDYETTRLAAAMGMERIAVQHHHAHMASCMAENGLTKPGIGVSLDGTGYGLDGAIWGGEFLAGDYRQFRRWGHLRSVGLPGGQQAVREPWRMALAYLIDAGCDDTVLARIPASDRQLVRAMMAKGLNSPSTSSAGRLFDAVASLAGVRDRVSFEGQAAIELEQLATEERGQGAPNGSYPFAIADAPFVVDTRPLIRAIVADVAAGAGALIIAGRFHSTLIEIIASMCERIRAATGLQAVMLSGGVFLNALLTAEVERKLAAIGFRVYRHRHVPPNDGGLSLGQLAVAAHHLHSTAR